MSFFCVLEFDQGTIWAKSGHVNLFEAKFMSRTSVKAADGASCQVFPSNNDSLSRWQGIEARRSMDTICRSWKATFILEALRCWALRWPLLSQPSWACSTLRHWKTSYMEHLIWMRRPLHTLRLKNLSRWCQLRISQLVDGRQTPSTSSVSIWVSNAAGLSPGVLFWMHYTLSSLLLRTICLSIMLSL